MDPLEQIIATLDSVDHHGLRSFTQRRRQRKDRLDLALLDLLLDGGSRSRSEMIKALYGKESEKNLEAYHALRKRLYALLMEFVLSKSTGSSADLGRRNLQFARYLFSHGLMTLGWKYLSRCEKQAEANEDYDLLNSIYNTYLEVIHFDGAPLLSDIERRKALNKAAEAEADRMRLALAYVKVRLKKVRLESRNLDPTVLLNQVINTYDLAELVAARPRFWFAFVQLVREALVTKKDFHTLADFLIVQQSKVISENVFEQSQFHYFLAHALYRAKRFPEALATLEKSRESSLKSTRREQAILQPRLILLESAIASFMGENGRAVSLLKSARKATYFQHADERRANLTLNLAVFLFQDEEFEAAREVIKFFPSTEKWCMQHMGLEWVLKFQLVEMIVELDSGRHDGALRIMRRIRKKFSELFDQSKYQRVPLFLEYVAMYVENEEHFMLPSTYHQMRADLVKGEAKNEDLQAMTYYAWLKSKMLRTRYYDTLLEVTRD